jgi:glycosyltransferase involved in cell wall biosynthesis
MHAVMYVPTNVGGHARYAAELLDALTKCDPSGFEWTLLTSADARDESKRSTSYKIEAVLPPQADRDTFPNAIAWAASRLRHYQRREKALSEWITKRRPAVLHLQEYSLFFPLYVRRLKRSCRVLVATVHNVRPHASDHVADAIDGFQMLALRQCSGLIVHEERLKRDLRRRIGASGPPIFVTQHGTWATPTPYHRMPGRRRLLMFGVMRRNKGLDTLLRAMHRLPEFRLTVAGTGITTTYGRELGNLMVGLEGRVVLTDEYVADSRIPELFGSHDIVVMPYRGFAAQSGVLHLAIAYGLPVVVSDAGAPADTVRRWKIGFVSPEGDSGALAEAIRRLDEPSAYSSAAAHIAASRESLSWDGTAQATLAAYSELLASSRHA